MSYATQLAKVKKVVSSVTAGDLNRVLVSGGRIYATDERLTASAEFPSDLEFFVDAEFLEFALKGKNVELSVSDGNLVVVSDGARYECESIPPKDFQRPDGNWVPVPPTLIGAFKVLQPFQAKDRTHLWACCVTVRGNRTYATNNQILGVWEGGGEDLTAAYPSWLIDYVLGLGEKTTGMIIDKKWIGFKFDDGTECLSGRIAREISDKVVQVADSIPRDAPAIDPDWKAAVMQVSEMPGCGMVKITPDTITGETPKGAGERKYASPTTKETYWEPQWLHSVLSVATHIDLDAWPNPAPWYGENVRGVIAGKTV